MKRAIINVAVDSWYPRGQERLENSLKLQGFKGDVIKWTNTWPKGCPPHPVLPYGFKSYAYQYAVEQGYESILWLDCSCWAIRPLEPLFEEIESKGHIFSFEGWYAGQWLKDSALETLGVTRDEALKIELLGGMFMGVCTRFDRSKQWLHEFIQVCQDMKTLPGGLRNVNGSVSPDPRCLGHVADQAVASVIAHKLGMSLTYPPKWRDWYKENPSEDTIIQAQGM